MSEQTEVKTLKPLQRLPRSSIVLPRTHYMSITRMDRLSNIPPALLSLHARAGTEETLLTPLNAADEEYCRLCQPSSLSIHLLGHPESRSITIIIDFGDVLGGFWRIHVDWGVWSSPHLARSIRGVEPILEFHPLGWMSENHQNMMQKWGAENGLRVSAEIGHARQISISQSPHD